MPHLSQSFFRRPVLTVAPELLGKSLVRSLPSGKVLRLRINEVEAYDGEKDLACHASRGKTERTAVMYEPGGVWYVYLVYGMYHMLNIVTGIAGYPSAILIRGASPVNKSSRCYGAQEISGPGRLTKHLQIDRRLNAKKSEKQSGLWIEDDGYKVSPRATKRTPRIGVAYAGAWAKKPYRFILQ